MRTKDFIAKQSSKIKSGERASGKCSSVFAEGDCIYSYGYHYPLLFKITTHTGKQLLVTNRRGYSSTTSKHISYASYNSDLSVILGHGIRYGNDLYSATSNYNNVINGLNDELAELSRTMHEKKRKDTQVYKSLQWQYDRVVTALALLDYKTT
jgi:hypothetical protein